jgi:hypothetical protein
VRFYVVCVYTKFLLNLQDPVVLARVDAVLAKHRESKAKIENAFVGMCKCVFGAVQLMMFWSEIQFQARGGWVATQ